MKLHVRPRQWDGVVIGSIAAETVNLMKLHVRPRQRDGVVIGRNCRESGKFNEAPCQTASAGWRGDRY